MNGCRGGSISCRRAPSSGTTMTRSAGSHPGRLGGAHADDQPARCARPRRTRRPQGPGKAHLCRPRKPGFPVAVRTTDFGRALSGACLAGELRGRARIEFHHPIEQQNALFDALMAAGKEFGIRPYGIKAMSALAVEKSYRLIPRELSIEYSAYKSGLDRFVHPNKATSSVATRSCASASRGSPGISHPRSPRRRRCRRARLRAHLREWQIRRAGDQWRLRLALR